MPAVVPRILLKCRQWCLEYYQTARKRAVFMAEVHIFLTTSRKMTVFMAKCTFLMCTIHNFGCFYGSGFILRSVVERNFWMNTYETLLRRSPSPEYTISVDCCPVITPGYMLRHMLFPVNPFVDRSLCLLCAGDADNANQHFLR